MIPKETLGIGEMGFIVCDLEVSLKSPFARDINLTNLPYLTSVLARDPSDFGILVIFLTKRNMMLHMESV